MAFDLPPAGNKYSQSNENQARKATELAIADILARLQRAEENAASGGGTATPPTAEFASVVDTVNVAFTDLSTPGDAAITTWAWDFGDGGASTLQNPSHTYAAAGDYTVSLTVEDADGETDTVEHVVAISVPNVGPTADFSFIATGLSVAFTNTSTPGSGAITSRSWQFGDGGTSTSNNPTHVYGSAGVKSVTLTVADANGLSDPVTKNVTVSVPSGIKQFAGLMQNPVGAAPANDGDPSSGYFTLSGSLLTTPSTVVAMLAEAQTKGIHLILNLPGTRSAWLPGGTYDPAIYEQKVRQYQNIPELAAAFAAKRASFFIGDEFYVNSTYHGSVSPRDMNDMGLLAKSIWPGVLTHVRISAINMVTGWSNTDGVTIQQMLNTTGFSGVDYMNSQYERSSFIRNWKLIDFLNNEKAGGASLNIGILPGLNWLGAGRCLETDVDPCWDVQNNGSSNGEVAGAEPTGMNAGTVIGCGASDPQRFLVPPDLIRKFADIVTADPTFPGSFMWAYPRDGFSWSTALQPYYYRTGPNTHKAAMDYWLSKSATAPTNGWRTPK